ncbi:hypothetical protein E2553_19380 [Paraburkholderia dipogonis]|uniref:Uncharacterized protein n=1 Tax=Paraburkholderia dipogonis TaxID=1211383 RepID=A0A4Y8NB28_9BURK|nr:hypothetical protein [Paraburkholderia dipogonis]TFE47000.1 hypothetical protein E2553_19380 [Paraburkholderia dipogonis]
MPTEYFTELELYGNLPRRLRELTEIIENHAELRIEAVSTDQKGMACEFGKGKARIQLPSDGPPRDNASVYHELLHLKRYFLDGVPKLVYCDDEHEFEGDADARLPQLFTRLDNQIEHLFIVPCELARYQSASRYWEERIGALLNDPMLPDDGALVAWAFVHRVLRNNVLSDAAQEQVNQRGLGDACGRFDQTLDESKEAATLCLFETFAPAQLPRACLDYFAQQQEVPLAGTR